jgi:taurine dioxygenase
LVGCGELQVCELASGIGGSVELDLATIDEEVSVEIRRLLAIHGVLVFPGQSLTADQQVALGERFGIAHGHPVREFVTQRLDEPISVIENDERKPSQDDQNFHTDYSFHTTVPDLAILRAEVIPASGGDTIWSSTTRAYGALSETMKTMIGGLHARHEAGERFWFEYSRALGDDATRTARAAFPGQVHPVVGRHPITGVPLLFVNEGYTTQIVELAPRESRKVLEFLFEHLNDPQFHYRHKWRPGDVVFWDEHATVHMGPHDFFPQHRRLTRVTAGRSAPKQYVAA